MESTFNGEHVRELDVALRAQANSSVVLGSDPMATADCSHNNIKNDLFTLQNLVFIKAIAFHKQ